jgi:hypothetical protein
MKFHENLYRKTLVLEKDDDMLTQMCHTNREN